MKPLRDALPLHDSDVEIFTELEPNCDVCMDTGYVRYDVPMDDARFGRMYPCPNERCSTTAQMREQQAARRFALAKLPPEFANLTFATWREQVPDDARKAKRVAFEASRAFCQSDGCAVDLAAVFERRKIAWPEDADRTPKNWLVLHGDYGVGKTGLAAAAFNCLLALGVRGVYVHTRDLFVSLQDTFSDDADETLKAALLRYKDAPLLFLDDLQVFNASDFRRETVELILGHRHAHLLPTLITTNLTMAGFRDQWLGAAASRVAQRAHWVHVPGPVLRRENRSF